MEYIVYYIIGIVIVLLGSGFLSGFLSRELTLTDVVASIFWPVTVFQILGGLTRMLLEYLTNKKDKNGKN